MRLKKTAKKKKRAKKKLDIK